MASESIGRMGYWLRAHSGSGNNLLIMHSMNTYPYVTFHFRDQGGAASFRYRNRAILMCEQKPYLVLFSCRRQSYTVLFEHSLTSGPGACQIFSVLCWHLIYFSVKNLDNQVESLILDKGICGKNSAFIAKTWHFKWWLFSFIFVGMGWDSISRTKWDGY